MLIWRRIDTKTFIKINILFLSLATIIILSLINLLNVFCRFCLKFRVNVASILIYILRNRWILNQDLIQIFINWWIFLFLGICRFKIFLKIASIIHFIAIFDIFLNKILFRVRDFMTFVCKNVVCIQIFGYDDRHAILFNSRRYLDIVLRKIIWIALKQIMILRHIVNSLKLSYIIRLYVLCLNWRILLNPLWLKFII